LLFKLGIKKGFEGSTDLNNRIIDVFRKIDDDEWVIAIALSYPKYISGAYDSRNRATSSEDELKVCLYGYLYT
jgi:hypothetical protein